MGRKFWPYMNEATDGTDGGGGNDAKAETNGNSGADGASGAAGDDVGGNNSGTGANSDSAGTNSGSGAIDISDKSVAWPDDWRQRSAKGDEKRLKLLERFASPEAAMDALVNATEKLKTTRATPVLKPDATPEEVTAWRTENGIPAKPEEYDISLPDGLVIGESDKPIVDGFLKTAHDNNMTPAQVKQSLSWYYAEQDRQREAFAERDIQNRAEAEEKLRAEWGADYKRNATIANNFLDSAPEGLKDRIMGARLADGSPMGNDPQFLNFLVNTARELNPVASVMPGSGGNVMQAMEAEITTLESKMKDSVAWHRDKKSQARYMELVSARDKGR